jgi:hypothetical protein
VCVIILLGSGVASANQPAGSPGTPQTAAPSSAAAAPASVSLGVSGSASAASSTTATSANASRVGLSTGAVDLRHPSRLPMPSEHLFQAGAQGLESRIDRPWTAPGADPTDWFNYGFDEETWKLSVTIHQIQSSLQYVSEDVRVDCSIFTMVCLFSIVCPRSDTVPSRFRCV